MVQRDIGELFLTGFINSIMLVSRKSPKIWEFKVHEEQRKRKEETNNYIISGRMTNIQTIHQKAETDEIEYFQKLNNFPQQTQDQRKTKLHDTNIKQMSAEERLNVLIKDPAVTEIECIGSDEALLVKKGGAIQKTRIKLSVEEIYQLIAEFSQKTKIPVIDGTLKTAVDNLILTAVLSEILGPKFILQKKNPFKPLNFS